MPSKLDQAHIYELTLLPTPAQEKELTRLMQASLIGSLVGGGLVEPLAPGWVALRGVSGAVRVATDWDRQLPPWAQVVLGREYPAGGRRLPVPELASAWRLDWADVRLERHGWTIDLAFSWLAWPAHTLTCGADIAGHEELQLLMGDGSQVRWPAAPPLPRG